MISDSFGGKCCLAGGTSAEAELVVLIDRWVDDYWRSPELRFCSDQARELEEVAVYLSPCRRACGPLRLSLLCDPKFCRHCLVSKSGGALSPLRKEPRGSLWSYVDYRKLKDNTRKNRYPPMES